MRELAVYERELDEVGRLNYLTEGFFSAADARLLFAVGLATNWIMQGTLDAKGTALLQFGGIAGALFAVSFFVAGVLEWRIRGTLINEMKTEAKDVEQTAQPEPLPTAVIPASSSSTSDKVAPQP